MVLRKYLVVTRSCVFLLLMAVQSHAGDAVFRSGMEIPTCAEVEYNSGLTVQAFPATWQDVFTLNYPNPLGSARRITVTSGNVVSLAFTASAAFPVTRIETSDSPGDPGGIHTLSISTCRADFRADVLNNLERNCMSSAVTSQQQLIVITGMGTSSAFCGLVAGQTYRLNIAYTAAGAGDPGNTCTAGVCALLLTARDLSQ